MNDAEAISKRESQALMKQIEKELRKVHPTAKRLTDLSPKERREFLSGLIWKYATDAGVVK